MEFKDCTDFANKIKECAVATCAGGQPEVRMLGLWFADESGFYFQAWTFKDVYKNLKENQKIEVCFYSKEEKPYTVLRLRGEAEFVNDPALKEKIWKERTFLKGLGAAGPDDPRLFIFRLSHGQASFWPKKTEGEYPGVDIVKF
jgi:pyridoxamine 5'-phosphate oxidase